MSTPIYDSVAKPVTTDAEGEPTLVPARKIRFAALWAGLAVIATAALAAVTPEMLDFAGQFTPVIYAAVVALASVVGGYAARP